MKCYKPYLSSAASMKSLKQLFLATLLPLTLLPAGSEVSLTHLLQPFEERKVTVAAKSSEQPTSEKPELTEPSQIKLTEKDAIEALLRAGRAAVQAGDSLEISIRSGWESVAIPAGADWELYAVDQFAPDNRGRWFPSLVLEVDGQVEKRWRLNSQVDLYRMVYMTTQRLGRGETPMRPGIHPVICNIYNESSRPLPVAEDLKNYEMVRTLGVGQFLTWDDVSPRRAVRKGETVEVILEKGSLSITMQAMCLQDGVVEETVRLKNPTTRSEFAGVVTAPGVVSVVN